MIDNRELQDKMFAHKISNVMSDKVTQYVNKSIYKKLKLALTFVSLPCLTTYTQGVIIMLVFCLRTFQIVVIWQK